jgi:hypothetical protein
LFATLEVHSEGFHCVARVTTTLAVRLEGFGGGGVGFMFYGQMPDVIF